MQRLCTSIHFSLFVLSFVIPSAAQQSDGVQRTPVITGIAIHGNKVTETSIILREMTLRVGDTISLDELQYCRDRIYSLGLFNRVEITYPPMDSTVLLVEVDERWYIYPYPILTIVERDFSKWQYGVGLTHQNFRGRNEKIFAGFALGYNPWAALNYSNPWIFGEGEFFYTAGFAFNRIENKSLLSRGTGPNFHEIHYEIGSSIGKRVDQYRSVTLSGSYTYLEVTEMKVGRTIDESGIDRFFSVGIGAKHDTRDLREYPTEGVYGTASVSKRGIFLGKVDYVLTAFDLRLYKKLFNGPSFAMRMFTRIASGPAVPNYEHQYFGFSERIRGHFDEEMEGESILGTSMEFRVPLIREFYIRMPEIPVEQFSTWRMGLYVAAFADAGTTWDRRERPSLTNLPRGFGLGLHLLLPYSFVFRVDRAWNEAGMGEWIFDVGASF